jgi:HAD superfamily hydrolase (TIGR01484 family)
LKYKYIFSDFDGTLTHKGEVSKTLIDVLSVLKKKNITFILVSGRSASWGHFFLTHFPISYAVMEAGGVILHKNKTHIQMQVLAKQNQLDKLELVKQKLHKEISELEFAVDNVGRITDRAIELSSLENPKTLKKVQQILDQNNCHYSVSNVHLNFSTVPNDKWSGACYLSKHVLKKDLLKILPISCFMGDAPNDEIMFQYFKHSLGVGNIKPYLTQMKYVPSTITKEKEIRGVRRFLKDAAIL